jgi:succinate dehydrogenase / fumarate reductase, membrane anchor subunit
MKYATNTKSQAQGWFLHRITGTFLVFLLLTHFWIQHFDSVTASVTHSVVEAGEVPSPQSEAPQSVENVQRGGGPEYPEKAVAAVEARRAVDPRFGAPGSPVTSYEVTMLRLADPVYAVLWKGFNILFLLFALHHGFYGLNNILTDYIRRPMLRAVATRISWLVALVLVIVGLYSVVTAGFNMEAPAGATAATMPQAIP